MFAERYRKTLRRQRLRFLFQGARAFGSGWHEFKPSQPCAADHVAAFEATWGISLPGEFRRLVTDIGNGGPGPYYGLSRLEAWCQPWSLSQVDATLLRQNFDPTVSAEQKLCPGALRICNAGCEHYVLLVVSGSHAGEIWHDARVDKMGVFPMLRLNGERMSVVEWLSEWLGALPDGHLESSFWSSSAFDSHAIAQVLAIGSSPPATIATDQLPCPACARRLRRHRPSPRVVVPTPLSRGEDTTLVNPKYAAILAAAGELAVIPREIRLGPIL